MTLLKIQSGLFIAATAVAAYRNFHDDFIWWGTAFTILSLAHLGLLVAVCMSK